MNHTCHRDQQTNLKLSTFQPFEGCLRLHKVISKKSLRPPVSLISPDLRPEGWVPDDVKAILSPEDGLTIIIDGPLLAIKLPQRHGTIWHRILLRIWFLEFSGQHLAFGAFKCYSGCGNLHQLVTKLVTNSN